MDDKLTHLPLLVRRDLQRLSDMICHKAREVEMVIIYDIQDARSLFIEVQDAFVEYCETPSERLFLFLVFSLNHLREWITKSGYKQIQRKNKSGAPLSQEEVFFYKLWGLEEFRTINHFCNQGKHCKTSGSEYKTSKIQRFRTGFSRCGDRLDQEYFLINGKDSRDYLRPIFKEYFDYFERANSQQE